MNTDINDGFMNPNRFGFAAIPFKLNGDKNTRDDIPMWRKNRSAARSMGCRYFTHTKPCECGSLLRRVYNLECYDCWVLKNEK